MAAIPAAAPGSKPAITSSSPPRTPSDISATVLLRTGAASARADLQSRRATSWPSFAISAAGRAWMPCACATTTASLITGVALAAGARSDTAPTASTSNSRSPAFTSRSSGAAITRNRSPLVMMTGVIMLGARRATRSRSNLSSTSPARTRSPLRTSTSKPSPPRPTVSMPTCSRTSAPPAARSATAWREAAIEITSPSQGALQFATHRIDGGALSQHRLREGGVRYFAQRCAPAGERREDGEGGSFVSGPAARCFRSPRSDRSSRA